MNITLPPLDTPGAHPELRAPAGFSPVRASRRAMWPLFGIAASVAGYASVMLSITDLPEEDWDAGPEVLAKLDHAKYHISFVLGIISVAAMFVAASGWKRWAEQRAPRSLAARTVGNALTATATINTVFACLAGSMSLYLPGGPEAGSLSDESIFVNYSLLDFGQLLGWWGGVVAAGCVAVLAFRRDRVLPRWMGVASVLLAGVAVGFSFGASVPGIPGIVMPVWLVVISIGLVFSRTAEA